MSLFFLKVLLIVILLILEAVHIFLNLLFGQSIRQVTRYCI